MVVNYDLKSLPVLLTGAELARLLGVTDSRRLHPSRKPVAQIFIAGKARPSFPLPLDTIYAARSVNANLPVGAAQ